MIKNTSTVNGIHYLAQTQPLRRIPVSRILVFVGFAPKPFGFYQVASDHNPTKRARELYVGGTRPGNCCRNDALSRSSQRLVGDAEAEFHLLSPAGTPPLVFA